MDHCNDCSKPIEDGMIRCDLCQDEWDLEGEDVHAELGELDFYGYETSSAGIYYEHEKALFVGFNGELLMDQRHGKGWRKVALDDVRGALASLGLRSRPDA